MIIRIDDAVLISDVTKADIGRALWPNMTYQAQLNQVYKRSKGFMKTTISEAIQIAAMCQVDLHFLVGMPSRYDELFEKITGLRAELQTDLTIKYERITQTQ